MSAPDPAGPEPSPATFRLLVESAANAIVIADENGRIIFVNLQAEKLFGYDRGELLGKSVDVLVPAQFRSKHPAYRQGFIAAPSARPMGVGRDLFGTRKDGTEVPVEIGLNPIRTERGQMLVAAIIVDITARKKTENELSLIREELARRAADLEAIVAKRTAHLERAVAELEAFSYTASHDLRAPLRAIQGYAHFLLKRIGGRLDAESRLQLERMGVSASRMDRLVQDLLAYSRVGRGEADLERVDLDSVVAHITSHYPGLDKIQLQVRSPLGPAVGQFSLLIQTLSNLIANAVKFVPKERTPSIDIWTERERGRVTVFVKDNGIGIDPAYQEKIFNPFVRLDPAGPYEGTGIGLAIVKKAVAQMGGRVRLEPTAGQGTTFAVELQDEA